MKFQFLIEKVSSKKKINQIKELRKKDRNKILLSFFLILFFISPKLIFATHISGGEITYKWKTGNTYEIYLTLYRDCAGSDAPYSAQVDYSSVSCNKTLQVVLSRVAGTGQEITQMCPTAATTCNGGSLTGIQQFKYKGTVTLPTQCADWKFSFTTCCRNCAITTLNMGSCASPPGTYLEATLNNLLAPTNSSPIFTNIPVSIICTGQLFNYNHGAYDADGDSLVYSMIAPRTVAGTNVNFASGYSASHPISSSTPFTINSQTGDLTMTPSAVEVGVMTVLVNEYRNGVLIGSVIRDMEVWTRACNNSLPTASGINGSTNFSVVACAGIPLSFFINSADLNSNQIVTMTWNNGVPGASFTVAGSPLPVGTFNWTPSLLNARPQPYTFTVTVQDNNCPSPGFQTYSYSITVPEISVTATSTDATCFTQGTATAVGVGAAPVNYLWSTGANTSTVTGIASGNYTVTITDALNCTATASVSVVAPPPLAASVLSSSNVSCYGGSNGSAAVNISGGTLPYNYSWSPSGGNNSSASNLSPGQYHVLVTDANSCTQDVAVTISQPAVLAANVNAPLSVPCNGDNSAAASVSVNGGTAPYSYSWTPGGFNTPNISGLGTGNYSVTINDSKGCSFSTSFFISQPTVLNTNSSSTMVACGASNGSATVTASGGTSPYTYQWSTGGTSTVKNGLIAGSYSVIVTDALGCTATEVVSVSNHGGPTLTINAVTPLNCSGDHDGSATVNVNAGSPPYTYTWSPSGGNANTATGLSEGTYTVNVTDANNCISSIPVDISAPTPLSISLSKGDSICLGEGKGKIISSVSGGSGSYQYTWTPGGSHASALNNLTNGNYQVVVTDNHGCTQTSSVNVNLPAAISGSVNSLTDVKCNGGSNGAASVTVSGGAPHYSYNWHPFGGQLATATGLRKGNYFVTVTDSNNCKLDIPFTISEPVAIVSTLIKSSVLCTGDTNGTITVNVSGGVSPYIYDWNPAITTTSAAINLSPGHYSIKITDGNGCTSSVSANINNPSPVVAAVQSVSDVKCFGGNSGAASISVTGGHAPYTYNWSSITNHTPFSSSLSANVYTITIRDAHQCSAEAVVAINEPTVLTSAVLHSSNVTCYNGSNGSAEIISAGGTAPYTYSWNPSGNINSSPSNLSAGNYLVRITDANNCTTSSSVNITQPAQINILATSTKSICGASTGTANAIVAGGVSPYTYSWLPGGGITANISGISSGNYSFTVTDHSGCTMTENVIVLDSSLLNISTSVTDVSCHGGSNGSVTASATNGVAPFHYIWSQGIANDETVSGLPAGNYSVNVSDANSCTQSASFIVNEPSELLTTTSASDVSCFGGSDGTINVNSSGGTNPYSSIINSSGNSASVFTNLPAGIYSVTTTDVKGCVTVKSATVNQPAVISTTSSSTPSACGTGTGSATLNVSGGTAPYNYLWTTGASNSETISNIPAGIYSAVITDSKNCTLNASVNVSNTNSPVLNISSLNDVRCSGGNDGSATVNAVGGTQPYQYSWIPSGGNSASATNLTAGNYSVQVTDANTCISIIPMTISERSHLVVSVNSSPALCFGASDGNATSIASAGITPYQYSWTSGDATADAHSLTAGNYSVTITDAIGCTASDSVLITQPQAINVNVTAHDATCFGSSNGSLEVNADGGTLPYSYTWSSGSNQTVVNNLAAGNYYVSVTDGGGCVRTVSALVNSPSEMIAAANISDVKCFGGNDGEAAVSVSGGISPYRFSWNTGETSESVTHLATGNYTVNVSDGNHCSVSKNIIISQPQQTVVTANYLPVFCAGQDATLSVHVTGGTQPYYYSWSNGSNNPQQLITADSASTYSVIVTDANNCTSQQVSLAISIYPPLSASGILTDTICEGQRINLSANASGGNGGPYIFSWDDGQTGSSVNVYPAATRNYTVSVTDNCTRIPATANIPVAVRPKPEFSFLSTEMNGCTPLQATFYNYNNATGVLNYEWNFGDGSKSTEKNPVHIFTTPGSYSVVNTVTDIHGCSNAVSAHSNIEVYPVPVSDFTVSTEEISILYPVAAFMNNSVDAKYWSWDFGDTTGNSTGKNPEYIYKNVGTYVVQLISTSDKGCVDTSYKKITVKDENNVFIPNAFTPDGDGKNDFFTPVLYGSAETELFIYDRWGINIFYSNDLQKPWDGRYQGKDEICPIDTYVYRFVVVFNSGKKKSYTGSVSLIK